MILIARLGVKILLHQIIERRLIHYDSHRCDVESNNIVERGFTESQIMNMVDQTTSCDLHEIKRKREQPTQRVLLQLLACGFCYAKLLDYAIKNNFVSATDFLLLSKENRDQREKLACTNLKVTVGDFY